MFGIGHAPEIIILLVIVLLVFGPGKLPEIGSAVGRGIREFRDATTGNDRPQITPAAPQPAIQQPAQQWAPQQPVAQAQPAPVNAEHYEPSQPDHVSAGH